MGEKERREGGPGGWRRRGRRGTKGRRVVINGEAIWFLLGDALLPPSLRGIPAVNEFVNGGRETVFRESFARISPSSVSRASTGGLERSRIIYAVVLWQRAPPSFTKNVFLSSQEDFVKSLPLLFSLFSPPRGKQSQSLSPSFFLLWKRSVKFDRIFSRLNLNLIGKETGWEREIFKTNSGRGLHRD